MKEPSTPEASTRVSRKIKAPRPDVYRAFLDPAAVAAWLPPESMTGRVLAFEPHDGGRFSMSLTYQDAVDSPGGKTTDDTDTFRGRFAELVPDEKVVWVVEFESKNPDFAGEMRVAWSLVDDTSGTEVTVLCENIPPGIRLEDNELGSRASLENLARLLER
jgi:uncharacterized protein YndB with AHSA1/START domain